jgi:hypothetical protein
MNDGRYVYETKRQGRIAHHLCIAAAMPPFFASKATRGRAPHIVALLGSTFHAANIGNIFYPSKPSTQNFLKNIGNYCVNSK